MTKTTLANDKNKDLLERIGGSFKDRYERAHAYYNLLKDLPEDEQFIAFEAILTNSN